MKDKINEALQGYQELKEEVEENPENARDAFLEILENPMMKNFFDTSDEIETVKELELPEETEEFKDVVDKFQKQVEI